MMGRAGKRSLRFSVDSQRAHTASIVESVCRRQNQTAWLVIRHTFGKRHHLDPVHYSLDEFNIHHTKLQADVTAGK